MSWNEMLYAYQKEKGAYLWAAGQQTGTGSWC